MGDRLKMGIHPSNQNLTKLRAKGGIMFFTIEKPAHLYRGTILLSPVENCFQRRAVYIREYRCADARNDNTGG